MANHIDCDYERFTFRDDDLRFLNKSLLNEHPLFTFEYPSCFREVPLGDDLGNFGITEVSFLRKGTGDLKGLPVESQINIIVKRPSEALGSNAKVAIEELLKAYENDPNLKIIERGHVSIAGISAEKITISVSKLDTVGFFTPHNRQMRLVAFDYAGFVWQIQMFVFEEEAEETQPYFEHLLQTFKILD